MLINAFVIVCFCLAYCRHLSLFFLQKTLLEEEILHSGDIMDFLKFSIALQCQNDVTYSVPSHVCTSVWCGVPNSTNPKSVHV